MLVHCIHFTSQRDSGQSIVCTNKLYDAVYVKCHSSLLAKVCKSKTTKNVWRQIMFQR